MQPDSIGRLWSREARLVILRESALPEAGIADGIGERL